MAERPPSLSGLSRQLRRGSRSVRRLRRRLGAALRRWRELPLRRRLATAAAPGLLLVALVATGAQAAAVRGALLAAAGHGAEAQAAAASGDLERASREAEHAHRQALRARRYTSGPLARVAGAIPLVGRQVKGTDALAAAASTATAAIVDAVAAGGDVPGLAAQVEGGDSASGTEVRRLLVAAQPAIPALEAADRRLARAEEELAAVEPEGLIAPVARAHDQLAERISHGRARIADVRHLLALAERLTDPSSPPRRLLLLSQDTWELRPSGGYIGSFGILELAGGKLRLVEYRDATELPEPTGTLQPPEPLRSALNRPWRLTGAGWWPDFPTSARAAVALWRDQGGVGEVDGVVAITQHVLEGMLQAFGPVEVPGYEEEITAANVADRIVHHTTVKRPLDTPRKRFTLELTTVLLARLDALDADDPRKLLVALARSVRARDIQLWMADPGLQEDVVRAGWAGALAPPPPGEDLIAFADANLGRDKSNRYVTKRIAVRVGWDDDGAVVTRARITTVDDGPTSAIHPFYRSYARVIVPEGSERLGDAEARFLQRSEREAPGLMSLGQEQLLQPRETGVRVLTWRPPAEVAGGDRYVLRIRPQAGSRADEWEVTVALGPEPVTLTFRGDQGDQLIDVPLRRF